MEHELHLREKVLEEAESVQASVMERLDVIGERIERIMEEVSGIHRAVEQIRTSSPVEGE
jgi:hypothetical protein